MTGRGGRRPDTHQHVQPHLDATHTLHILLSFLSKSEETSLSMPLVLCVGARVHSHTHVHTLPSAAEMAPSCQNILAFSHQSSKAQLVCAA